MKNNYRAIGLSGYRAIGLSGYRQSSKQLAFCQQFFEENQQNKSLLLLGSLTSFSIETLKILEREAQ